MREQKQMCSLDFRVNTLRDEELAGVISEEMGLDEILRKHVKVRGNKACNRTLYLLGIEGEITEIRFCYRDDGGRGSSGTWGMAGRM